MKDINSGLEIIATKEFNNNDEIYKITDFLNKNLSNYNLVFGVKLREDIAILNIYKNNQ